MMKSLRKDTGGYALLYVMVIVFVLCAISMTICTVALRNLQSQEASVKRMEEKYTAEGEIEKLKALAENDLITADEYESEETAKSAYASSFKAKAEELGLSVSDANDYTLSAASGSVVVTAEFDVAITTKSGTRDIYGDSTDTSKVTGTKTYYTIEAVTVNFISYTIENTGGAA